MPSIAGSRNETATLMGIASGQPPNQMYVNFRASSTYLNNGFLAPMQVLLARLESDNPDTRRTDRQGNWLADPSPEEIERALEMIRERVPDQVWPVVYRAATSDRGGIPEGKNVWALPTSILVRAMVYRKDVFRQAQLDPNRPPQTWEDLLEASRRISAMPGRTGIVMVGGINMSWSIYSFMVSNNVRYMSLDDDGRWRASYGTRQAAESIYYLLKLVYGEYQDGSGQTVYGAGEIGPGSVLRERWEAGKIGIRFEYLRDELMSQINSELVGIAPVPIPPGGDPSGELNAVMIGVFAGSNPQQQLAVMKYAWFATSDEAQRIRVETLVEYGLGPFLSPSLLEKFEYDDILRRVPEGWKETFDVALAHGVPEPYGDNTQYIYQKVTEPIEWARFNATEGPNSINLLGFSRDEAIDRIHERLVESETRVNEFVLGQLTEQQWRTRRVVGGFGMTLIFALFGGTLWYIWRAFGREEAAHANGQKVRWRKFIPAYLMLGPALALVLLWQYLPVILGTPLALFDVGLVADSKFVGIDNFATVLFDPRFWGSLVRTFYFVALVVGLGFWPPIAVAILLDEVPTEAAKYTYRTIFYLPAIISGTVMLFLWVQLYLPNEEGALNQVLMSLNALGPVAGTLTKLLMLALWLSLIGLLLSLAYYLRELSLLMRGVLVLFAVVLIGVTLSPLYSAYVGPSDEVLAAAATQALAAGESFDPEAQRGIPALLDKLSLLFGSWNIRPLHWLQDPGLAMLCIVIPGIWGSAGPGCIIYLAALKTVPDELIEAASIDGAGILQKLCYIALPRLKFLILIQFIAAVIGAFKGGANIVLAMTGGGPQRATTVLGMEIFQRTFMELQYGVGAAMGWMLGGIVIVLTAYQLKRMSRAEFKTADTPKQAAP